MGVAWQAKVLTTLLALLTAGCGTADKGLTTGELATPTGFVSEANVILLAPAHEPAGSPPSAVATPAATPLAAVVVPTWTPQGRPNAPAHSNAAATATPIASVVPRALAPQTELLEAAQNSPFHQFGDDVYTWDRQRRVVVLAVPASHPSLRELPEHRDGAIVDTPGTRSWVQQCARRHADQALEAPAAVYGAITAWGVYSCLGGLVRLSDLFASYWWTKAGMNCVADAVTAHSLHGDARPRPLSVCPSVGYDPTAPRPPGWLDQRCAEIVADNPAPQYPATPTQSGHPLPSCWGPAIDVVQAHAAERVEIGLPDSPHNCYHAFLGYVWARQTGRESRPPDDLAIGCQYRAFEAIP